MDRSHFCKAIREFLSSSPVLSTVPSSIFLYGVEELMELKLSCPCRHEMSKRLITSIFVGPPVLLFAIVFILLNPLRYVCQQRLANESSCAYLTACFKNAFGIFCQCCGDKTNVDRLMFWKDLGRCLILPIIWVIILLLDGDYLACLWTNWEGKHVFDKEIKKMWCQPTKLVNASNESAIQHEYQTFISESQFIGYLLLGAFGFVIILIVALSNCCNKSLPMKNQAIQLRENDLENNAKEGRAINEERDAAQGTQEGDPFIGQTAQ